MDTDRKMRKSITNNTRLTKLIGFKETDPLRKRALTEHSFLVDLYRFRGVKQLHINWVTFCYFAKLLTYLFFLKTKGFSLW